MRFGLASWDGLSRPLSWTFPPFAFQSFPSASNELKLTCCYMSVASLSTAVTPSLYNGCRSNGSTAAALFFCDTDRFGSIWTKVPPGGCFKSFEFVRRCLRWLVLAASSINDFNDVVILAVKSFELVRECEYFCSGSSFNSTELFLLSSNLAVLFFSISW